MKIICEISCFHKGFLRKTILFKVKLAHLPYSMLSYLSMWTSIPNDKIINQTINSLKNNGINVLVVSTSNQAKKKVLELIPEGSEVMTATSTTLDQIGLTRELNESGKFNSTKNELKNLNRESDQRQMQRIGAAPEIIIGSVHAVSQDGKVFVASNTGSQLPGYVYGADKVIWVVSAKKIVKDQEEALKRIYEHVLPLESERARKAYGTSVSNVSKLLIFNKEVNPERITLIFVKEDLGF